MADPRPAGARSLVGEPAGPFRLWVGDYRVIYQVEEDRVVVTVVGWGTAGKLTNGDALGGGR